MDRKQEGQRNSLDDKAGTLVERSVEIQAISSDIAYAMHDHIVPTLEDNHPLET